jgi:hypothetical protein
MASRLPLSHQTKGLATSRAFLNHILHIMETSPTSMHIKARVTNKDAHPGQPDVDEERLRCPVPRCKQTKAEILASKQAAQEKKEAKAAAVVTNFKRREEGVQDIAQFENNMELDDVELKKEAAQPTPKLMAKICRPTGK